MVASSSSSGSDSSAASSPRLSCRSCRVSHPFLVRVFCQTYCAESSLGGCRQSWFVFVRRTLLDVVLSRKLLDRRAASLFQLLELSQLALLALIEPAHGCKIMSLYRARERERRHDVGGQRLSRHHRSLYRTQCSRQSSYRRLRLRTAIPRCSRTLHSSPRQSRRRAAQLRTAQSSPSYVYAS